MNKKPQSSPSSNPHFSTETLEKIEWNLRTRFEFGDLRPFEFCIGARLVRFPDRSDLANPQINLGANYRPTPEFPARTDIYVVVEHIFPPGFESGKEEEEKPRKSTRSVKAVGTVIKATGKKAASSKKMREFPDLPEPLRKNGKPDWAQFISPPTSGLYPFNTVLPSFWQYGDPIPGALVE